MLLGNSGHPTIARPAPEPDLEEHDAPEGRAPALPSTCVRVLSSPRQPGCPPECPGVQRDGGCLCDVVRSANARGVRWRFEVAPDGYWDPVVA